jgi:hypothetical protein
MCCRMRAKAPLPPLDAGVRPAHCSIWMVRSTKAGPSSVPVANGLVRVAVGWAWGAFRLASCRQPSRPAALTAVRATEAGQGRVPAVCEPAHPPASRGAFRDLLRRPTCVLDREAGEELVDDGEHADGEADHHRKQDLVGEGVPVVEGEVGPGSAAARPGSSAALHCSACTAGAAARRPARPQQRFRRAPRQLSSRGFGSPDGRLGDRHGGVRGLRHLRGMGDETGAAHCEW